MRKIQNDELGRLSVDDFKASLKRPVALVLDNIRSLNNIGSVFRTADAFRFEEIRLCGITATPPHREIRKTALGAEDSVSWMYSKSVISALMELKEEGYQLVAIEQTNTATELNNFFPDKNKKYAFIFGHEVNGVSQEALDLCDMAVVIPQDGTKHSLNISVCAGIIAWHYCMGTQ